MIIACKSLYGVIHMVYVHINSLPYNDDRLDNFFSLDFLPRFPTAIQHSTIYIVKLKVCLDFSFYRKFNIIKSHVECLLYILNRAKYNKCKYMLPK